MTLHSVLLTLINTFKITKDHGTLFNNAKLSENCEYEKIRGKFKKRECFFVTNQINNVEDGLI